MKPFVLNGFVKDLKCGLKSISDSARQADKLSEMCVEKISRGRTSVVGVLLPFLPIVPARAPFCGKKNRGEEGRGKSVN